MTEQSILWTRAKLADFKKAYDRAVASNAKEFKWRDEAGEYRFVTNYAFYLIEYLESALPPT